MLHRHANKSQRNKNLEYKFYLAHTMLMKALQLKDFAPYCQNVVKMPFRTVVFKLQDNVGETRMAHNNR